MHARTSKSSDLAAINTIFNNVDSYIQRQAKRLIVMNITSVAARAVLTKHAKGDLPHVTSVISFVRRHPVKAAIGYAAICTGSCFGGWLISKRLKSN